MISYALLLLLFLFFNITLASEGLKGYEETSHRAQWSSFPIRLGAAQELS